MPLDGTDAGSEDEPLVHDLIYAGTKVLLVARAKTGKTYFALPLCAAVCNGEPFLTLATEPARVLYLSEEPRGTFEQKLEQFGLESHGDFRYVRRAEPALSRAPWAEIAEAVRADARDHGAGLVVVDSFARWAGLREGQENDEGAIGAAIEPLHPLTEDGVAVLVLHHSPWSANRSRGSSRIPADFDDLYFLDGGPGTGPRVLESLGGRHEPSWQHLAYQLSRDGDGPTTLEYVGDQRLNSASKTEEVVTVVRNAEEPLTTAEVAAELHWNERTVQRWLGRAYRHGLIARETGPPAGTVRWRRLRRFEYLQNLVGSTA